MSQLNVNNITKYTGGEVVVNDASEDVDFRVESDGNANMLFVDGGSNAVGIGTTTMTRTLNVTDTSAGASTGIQLIGANDGTQGVWFGDTDDTNVGEISYDHSLNKMQIRTADAYAIVIDSAGIVTKPLQPAFLANSSSSQTITNATSTTIVFASVILDRNSDFDGTSTFTAPVTGLYAFSSQIVADAGGGTDTRFSEARIKFIASNRSAQIYHGDLETNADDRMGLSGAVFIDMDASDTLTIEAFYSRFGASGSVDTIYDATTMYTFLTGYLIC